MKWAPSRIGIYETSSRAKKDSRTDGQEFRYNSGLTVCEPGFPFREKHRRIDGESRTAGYKRR